MEFFEFQKLVVEEGKTPAGISHLVDKYLIHGEPYIFENAAPDFYEFRSKIAEHFRVHFMEVHVTGSAKTGWSYWKQKEFRITSDVDIAIVSESQFEKMMWDTCEFQYALRNKRIELAAKQLEDYNHFLRYCAMGWIRPDKMPAVANLGTIRREWKTFFSGIGPQFSQTKDYKVNAGLYKSLRHLKEYIASGLASKQVYWSHEL